MFSTSPNANYHITHIIPRIDGTSPHSLEENGYIGLMIRDFTVSGQGEKAVDVYRKMRHMETSDDPTSNSIKMIRIYQVVGLIYAIYYKLIESAADLKPLTQLRDDFLWQCQPHLDLESLDQLVETLLLAFSEAAHQQQPFESYNELIQKAIHFIKSKAKQKLSLKDVAAELHVNACYLSSIFKKETGKAMTVYIAELKIEEAKQLLIHTDLSITQICYEIGYDNPSYFTEVFKKFAGLTPKDFKQQNTY